MYFLLTNNTITNNITNKVRFTEMLSLSFRDMTLDQIRWVLTVPALWTDEQKYFMREVAVEVMIWPHLKEC